MHAEKSLQVPTCPYLWLQMTTRQGVGWECVGNLPNFRKPLNFKEQLHHQLWWLVATSSTV
jgi:hypothetical protein